MLLQFVPKNPERGTAIISRDMVVLWCYRPPLRKLPFPLWVLERVSPRLTVLKSPLFKYRRSEKLGMCGYLQASH